MKTRATQGMTKALLIAAFPAALLLSGCPVSGGIPGGGSGGGDDAKLEYDAGFADGFAEDAEYWTGFDHSYDTVDGGEILYDGHLIPVLDEVSYDAGYYDGIWYAYNDGYFVAYDYAFTIGFSEGYDVAFGPDWETFLLNDVHTEWLDGGFSDGYNDGFSEGRILGASDWLDGLPFDWLDALLWYQSTDENGNLNDIYFEDLDIGTGEFGPVFLYQYGTNPHELVKGTQARSLRKGRDHVPSIRGKGLATKQDEGDIPALSYRPLREDVQANFDVRPTTTARSDKELTLESTWLERVNAYNAAYSKQAPVHKRSTVK